MGAEASGPGQNEEEKHAVNCMKLFARVLVNGQREDKGREESRPGRRERLRHSNWRGVRYPVK
jgi:hypothetical protein